MIVKKIRHRIETFLVNFGVWWLPKLSRGQVLLLSKGVGLLAFAIDYRGRATAIANLKVAFSRENITHDQARRIAIGSFQNFARTFLDLFWIAGHPKEELPQIAKLSWQDPGTPAMAKSRGALWVTPHFGNFEVLSLIVGLQGFTQLTIAQDFKNEALTDIFARLRQKTGHEIIPQQGAMLRIFKQLKRNGHASLLADLTVKPGRAATVIECFGLKTCVPNLHTSLAFRLGLPLLPATALPLSDGTYRCHFLDPMEATDYQSIDTMTQAVWDRFEPQIRQHPECWMWMYKHWRYLPGTESDSIYPAYANPNRQFREMLPVSQLTPQ